MINTIYIRPYTINLEHIAAIKDAQYYTKDSTIKFDIVLISGAILKIDLGEVDETAPELQKEFIS